MALRDDLLDVVDFGRRLVEDLGLRRTLVYLRTRRWYSGAVPPWALAARGKGYPVDTETPVVPSPRVRTMDLRYVADSAGRFQIGDILLERITPRNDVLALGLELHAFVTPTTGNNDEQHMLLINRGGTPWHVREGTARLIAAGPFDVPGAIVTVNALRGAYPGHLPDALAHLAPDSAVVAAPAATDQATAITLANALRAVWVAHRASLVFHPATDPYPLTALAATDAQSLLVLLHDLLRAFNAHAAHGLVSECSMVEAHGDKAFQHTAVVRPTRRTPG